MRRPRSFFRSTVLVLAMAVPLLAAAFGSTKASCVPVDPETPVSYVEIELHLDTFGGFTGQGVRDVHIADSTARVHDPFADPGDCTTLMQTDFNDLLLPAAEAVDWDAVAETYRPPDNPMCCCDQILTELVVTLTTADGETSTYETDWCSQSLSDPSFPPELLAFVHTVEDVGDQIWAYCN